MESIKEKWILPSDPMLQYMGRIDFEDENAPVFVYPCSMVKIRFRGKGIDCVVANLRSYFENFIGVILDGEQKKLRLPDSGKCRLTLAEDLADTEHDLAIFKRMDACHYFVFHGFLLPEGGEVLALPPMSEKRMEFYGDSVTAGEVCEAVDYCGQSDPPHNGQYSNSWFSYSWCTARRIHAQIHNIAQGGIALLHGTGYFCGPELLGMEEVYDKIQCNPYIQPTKEWDFSKYTPQVVVVAIGQNDSHPSDIMEQGIENKGAVYWREHYAAFIRTLRARYPSAEIILSTTILNHGKNWDLAIDAACRELTDEKIHHFLYSNNGCGTPGHIRIPEAERMAEELSNYILSLGEKIWEDGQ